MYMYLSTYKYNIIFMSGAHGIAPGVCEVFGNTADLKIR